MSSVSRRTFAKQTALAAALPLAAKWPAPAGPQEKDNKTNAPLPRSEELKKRAEEQRERMTSTLRAKPLPYDLEPAFVFAAKPRGRRRQGGNEVRR